MTRSRSRQIARAKFKKFYGLHKLHSSLIVHHKDGNPFNNEIENLDIMTRARHTSYHIKKYLESKPIEGIEELEVLLYFYNRRIWI